MIFLSHSWENKPVARWVVEALAREGLPTWLHEQQLQAGDQLGSELLEAIAPCDAFIYLVSPSANASEWVQQELKYAWGREESKRLKIVPVRLAADATALPALLHGRVYRTLDVADGGGAARLAHELSALPGPERFEVFRRHLEPSWIERALAATCA